MYFDNSLAMGRLFESFSTVLKWIALNHIRRDYIAKILDDLFLLTDSDHPCSDLAFTLLKALFKYLGVPLTEDKCISPYKCLVCLGLEIDIVNIFIKLLINKVKKCVQLISALMVKKMSIEKNSDGMRFTTVRLPRNCLRQSLLALTIRCY